MPTISVFKRVPVLPAAHAVVVQFESNPETALEIRDRMSDLIYAVQSQLKVVS